MDNDEVYQLFIDLQEWFREERKKARDAYNKDPSKFLGRPKLPKYKHKTEGRNLLVYTIQAMSRGKRGENVVSSNHLCFLLKCIGITVKITEESYTSKASLLNLDPLPIRNESSEKHTFSGKRVKRGLYRASDGRKLNANINGAGNIIRKVAPDAFGLREVEDGKAVLASLVVHPVRIVVPRTKSES